MCSNVFLNHKYKNNNKKYYYICTLEKTKNQLNQYKYNEKN